MKAGWEEVSLGEIAELRGRIGWKGLTAKEYTEEGPLFLSVHSLNYGDYVDFRDAFHISQERYDESPEIMLQRDDLLICKDGAGIGKLGIVPELNEPTTINSSLLLIRPGERVDPKFLYYCLLSPYFQRIVQSKLEGATTPHLYQRDITTFPVYLPPLEEQRRVVAVLDEAFEGLARARENTEANLASAQELYANALTKLISDMELAYSATTLGSICDFENGDRGKNYPGRKAFVPSGIPFINAGHLEAGAIDWESMNFIPEEHFNRLGNGKIRLNDLLFCLRGSLGKFARVDRNDKGAIASSLVILRCREGALPEYLEAYLASSYCQQMIDEYAGGAAQPNLSAKSVKSFKLPLPTMAEQRVVAEKHGLFKQAVAELRDQFELKVKSLDDLRQSLLQKAFAGELT